VARSLAPRLRVMEQVLPGSCVHCVTGGSASTLSVNHPPCDKKKKAQACEIYCLHGLQKQVNNNIPGALASSMHMLPCCSSGQNLTPYWLPVRPAFNSSFYGVCALRADSGAI
jgi:hypothetical protein